jgi:hypothetical protein
MQLPIQSQPVPRNIRTAKMGSKTGIMASSRWHCILFFGTQPEFQGTVDTPWSNNPGAGVWACNHWISRCGNDPGGCEAFPA